MSAWLCNEEHIFEMAAYYINNCQKYKQIKQGFKEVSNILWRANLDSLAARYGDEDTPLVFPQSAYLPIVTNPFHMAKLVDCYAYQSCEFDGWQTSEAFTICEAMRSSLLSVNGDYEEAPWGFDYAEYKEKFVTTIDNVTQS